MYVFEPGARAGGVTWQLLRRQSVPLERAGPRHQLAGRARLGTAPRRAAVKLRAPLVPETVATGTVVAGKRLFEESPGPDQTIAWALRAAAQGSIQGEELGETLVAKAMIKALSTTTYECRWMVTIHDITGFPQPHLAQGLEGV